MRLVGVVLAGCAAGCATSASGPEMDSSTRSLAARAAEPLREPPAPRAYPLSTGPKTARQAAVEAVEAASRPAAKSTWRESPSGDSPARAATSREPAPRETAWRESTSGGGTWRDEEGPLAEDRLVGSNRQPEWTTAPRFATTDAYVLAPGEVEVAQRWVLATPRNDGPHHAWRTDAAVGIDGGFQADVFADASRAAHDGPTKYDGAGIEGRWAIAKWGELPLNPTLDAFYLVNHRASDTAGGRILLAENLGGGWRWAGDASFSERTGGDRVRDVGLSTGISRTIVDERFSVGAEATWDKLSTSPHRGDNDETKLLVGPSIQWRPMENVRLDVAPLFGLSRTDRRDPRMELWVVLAVDFGPSRSARD